MPDSYPTSWKEPYHQALKESNERKLTELVQAAENAIVLRLHELENYTDHYEERIEMECAAADLLVIKTYKLRWPDPARSLTAMNETREERCGKCEAEIDPNRRVDFTLKDGTRVCEQCFIRGNLKVASGIDRFYRH